MLELVRRVVFIDVGRLVKSLCTGMVEETKGSAVVLPRDTEDDRFICEGRDDVELRAND